MPHPNATRGRSRVEPLVVLAGIVVTALLSASAMGATLCVAPGGKSGCYASIKEAVQHAMDNDIVKVARGVYHEDVIVQKPLSLVGAGAGQSIIDATGLLNGINVDGLTNGGLGGTGLAHVVISGFTVRNAQAQGIVVTNASSITISSNHVTGNDKALDPKNLVCPGVPVYFIAGEGFDCGEGIHLSGVDHSVVAKNLVENNAGGILLSDDTGKTHDNFVTDNVVQHNAFDCGITLASHNIPALYTPPEPGVFANRIIGNNSSYNGLATDGEGAGVGIFAAAPGAMNYGNTVADNVLVGNGLPGVTMHSHAPGQSLDDNVIVRNRIARNAADGDTPTSGPTGIVVFSAVVPVHGIVIAQNVIKEEDIGVAVAAAGSVDVHLNSLQAGVGVQNLASGSVDATQNWWKCSGGPDAPGCSTVSGDVAYAPWLRKPF